MAEKVVGVEIVGEAVEAARENAARNGLGNCEFLAGDVLQGGGRAGRKAGSDRSGSAARWNPSEGDRKEFEFWRQPHGLCVLQTDQTLARDLEPIQAAGYQVDKVCCVDMFPHTANCETVVSLTRKK